MDWRPIAETEIGDKLNVAQNLMSAAQRRLWDVIRIAPEKWRQHPYGDVSNGFWVVALMGRTVIWYNDIEDGFNRSRYTRYGTIDDYWCNQDELKWSVQHLLDAIESGWAGRQV